MTIMFNHGMLYPYPVKWVEHRLCKLDETHRLDEKSFWVEFGDFPDKIWLSDEEAKKLIEEWKNKIWAMSLKESECCFTKRKLKDT